MRRSMKRLKTFKQVRPTEGTSSDPNSIPLESIGGKKYVFTHLNILYPCFIPIVFGILFPYWFLCLFWFISFISFLPNLHVSIVCRFLCLAFIFLFGFSHNPNSPPKKTFIISTKDPQTNVSAEEEIQPTIGEHISFAVGHLTDLICQHSYVFSNIMMMVSWFGLHFLKVFEKINRF